MKNVAVIIPCLNPDERLISYTENLATDGFNNIIVIDDGSDREHKRIFASLNASCTILTHAVNLGKGRALKDAFNYVLTHNLDVEGVITVDCDGQHTSKDVSRMADELEKHGDGLILGSRDFSGDNIPFKSKWGNRFTSTFFKLLHGVYLRDTQTGLRALPIGIVDKYIDMFGERFEYETNMLIMSVKNEIPIYEMPIETIYENNNEGTHFNPIRDSWAIYKLIFGTFFKYSISSILSFLIDIGLFQLFLSIAKGAALSVTNSIFIATALARIASSLFNFSVNKNVVFEGKEKTSSMFAKYYILCAIQLLCSASLVALVKKIMPFAEAPIKVVVDALLFLVSYQIQKRFVFKSKE